MKDHEGKVKDLRKKAKELTYYSKGKTNKQPVVSDQSKNIEKNSSQTASNQNSNTSKKADLTPEETASRKLHSELNRFIKAIKSTSVQPDDAIKTQLQEAKNLIETKFLTNTTHS